MHHLEARSVVGANAQRRDVIVSAMAPSMTSFRVLNLLSGRTAQRLGSTT
jgi:hypothetical protein